MRVTKYAGTRIAALVLPASIFLAIPASSLAAGPQVMVCGQVNKYVAPSQSSAGQLVIDHALYQLAPGSAVTGSVTPVKGLDRCMDLSFSSSGDIVDVDVLQTRQEDTQKPAAPITHSATHKNPSVSEPINSERLPVTGGAPMSTLLSTGSLVAAGLVALAGITLRFRKA